MTMEIRILVRMPQDSRVSMMRTGGVKHVPVVNVNDGTGGKPLDFALGLPPLS